MLPLLGGSRNSAYSLAETLEHRQQLRFKLLPYYMLLHTSFDKKKARSRDKWAQILNGLGESLSVVRNGTQCC